MTLNLLLLEYHSNLFTKSKTDKSEIALIIRKTKGTTYIQTERHIFNNINAKEKLLEKLYKLLRLLAYEAFEKLKTHKLV